MKKSAREVLYREVSNVYPTKSKDWYFQYWNGVSLSLAAKVALYEYLLEDIRDNYDCEEDAHRYGNLHMCRCCKAEQALNGKDPWGHDD